MNLAGPITERHGPSSYDCSVMSLVARFPRDLRVPKILLVDDDPVFRFQMRKVAKREGIPLIDIAGPHELALASTDVELALIDFHLDDATTGYDAARLVEDFFGPVPALIVTGHPDFLDPGDWPGNVKDVISKALGPYAIYNAALETYEWAIVNREILC